MNVYMIVNLMRRSLTSGSRGISRGARKLARTSAINKKINNNKTL
jgi:hypothetical protein